MVAHGYNKTLSYHYVYVPKFDDGDFIILLLYVDNMLVVDRDMKKICMLKDELGKSFAMKDLDVVKQVLGM